MDRKAHLWKASLAVKGQIPLLHMSRVESEVLVMLPVRALVRPAADQPVAALAPGVEKSIMSAIPASTQPPVYCRNKSIKRTRRSVRNGPMRYSA
jgi:hypothetical protein